MFEIYKDRSGKSRFRLRARNGEIICASQGYASRSGCMKGIKSLAKNSASKASFDAKKIEDNANELLKTVQKMRPTSIKGTYIKSIFMSSTMSPSISIETKIA